MSLITALIFKALAQIFIVVTRRNARPWAEGLAYGTIELISKGLPPEAAAMLRQELRHDFDQRIWEDLKRGRSNGDLAIHALSCALNLMCQALGLRVEYAATAGLTAQESSGIRSNGGVWRLTRRAAFYASDYARFVAYPPRVAMVLLPVVTTTVAISVGAFPRPLPGGDLALVAGVVIVSVAMMTSALPLYLLKTFRP